jgi:excisionase family DNA binding protein
MGEDETEVLFPRLLTARDVARIVNVPVSTIQHWALQGDGPPSFKIGKHRRFAAEDVLRWLAEARGVA